MKTVCAIAVIVFAGILSGPTFAAQDTKTLFEEGSRNIHRIKVFLGEINRIDRTVRRNRETADRIEALERERVTLQRDVVAEQRALLKILRECDERLERILRIPAEDRDQEEGKDADLLALLKTRAIDVIGPPYIYDNFFFLGVPRLRGNHASVFGRFPCADLLSRTDEPTAVLAVMHLVQSEDLTEGEQIFCARFLIERVRIHKQNNEHLRNRLLKESEELTTRIKESLTASDGERENASQLLQRVDRKYQSG